ncbi:sulfur carrier protein ThiS [Paenibacillus turpanensis]|uniref:sulfur carrier protein ThiS n=1 Tax=Paenibacillus turpanensis TaxID=2689078 RepID=UPI0014072C83
MQVTITVNGEQKQLQAATLADVITLYELENQLVVLEADGVIVPKDQWVQTEVRDGMVLEIVHFVGGG